MIIGTVILYQIINLFEFDWFKFLRTSAKHRGGATKAKVVWDTRTSNVVSHHRTNPARRYLTSEIGRVPVLLSRYGPRYRSPLATY